MRREILNKPETNGSSALGGRASAELESEPQAGYGTAIAHHGEILQGTVQGKSGRLHHTVVSLPCGIFKSEAIFMSAKTGTVTVEPAWKIKAQKAAALVLEYYGLENWGGAIQIFSNIHVGWGLGSSTSDVTATIRAVSDAFNKKPDPTEIAILAVKAERASDSIMFNGNAVLFASREGFVVEGLAGAVPVLEVLGFNTDPTGVGIDTLNFSPAHYSWWEIEAFRPLLGLLRRAVHTQDVRLVGQVASASALINQRFLPKPHFEELNAVVKETGSVGLQVAHSGTTVGLLFDPNDPATPVGIRKAEKLIARMGLTETWRFQTRAS